MGLLDAITHPVQTLHNLSGAIQDQFDPNREQNRAVSFSGQLANAISSFQAGGSRTTLNNVTAEVNSFLRQHSDDIQPNTRDYLANLSAQAGALLHPPAPSAQDRATSLSGRLSQALTNFSNNPTSTNRKALNDVTAEAQSVLNQSGGAIGEDTVNFIGGMVTQAQGLLHPPAPSAQDRATSLSGRLSQALTNFSNNPNATTRKALNDLTAEAQSVLNSSHGGIADNTVDFLGGMITNARNLLHPPAPAAGRPAASASGARNQPSGELTSTSWVGLTDGSNRQVFVGQDSNSQWWVRTPSANGRGVNYYPIGDEYPGESRIRDMIAGNAFSTVYGPGGHPVSARSTHAANTQETGNVAADLVDRVLNASSITYKFAQAGPGGVGEVALSGSFGIRSGRWPVSEEPSFKLSGKTDELAKAASGVPGLSQLLNRVAGIAGSSGELGIKVKASALGTAPANLTRVLAGIPQGASAQETLHRLQAAGIDLAHDVSVYAQYAYKAASGAQIKVAVSTPLDGLKPSMSLTYELPKVALGNGRTGATGFQLNISRVFSPAGEGKPPVVELANGQRVELPPGNYRDFLWMAQASGVPIEHASSNEQYVPWSAVEQSIVRHASEATGLSEGVVTQGLSALGAVGNAASTYVTNRAAAASVGTLLRSSAPAASEALGELALPVTAAQLAYQGANALNRMFYEGKSVNDLLGAVSQSAGWGAPARNMGEDAIFGMLSSGAYDKIHELRGVVNQIAQGHVQGATQEQVNNARWLVNNVPVMNQSATSQQIRDYLWHAGGLGTIFIDTDRLAAP